MNVISKRIRLLSWVLTSFVNKQKKALVSSILIGLVLFVVLRFFVPYITETNIGKPKFKIGLFGKYDQDNLPTEILDKLSYGLVNNLPDGTFQLQAAQDITLSDDRLKYAVKLKDNLIWTDGQKVNSRDINVNIEGATIDYPSDNEIIYSVEKPFSPFLTLLDRPLFRHNLIGLGPYRIRKNITEAAGIKSIIIYSDTAEYSYKIYPNVDLLLEGFRLGEINQFTVFKNNLLDINKDKVKISAKTKTDSFLAIFFNTKDPLFSEKTIRQSLAYALKDKSMGNPPCLTSITPDSFAYTAKIKEYQYDPQKAREFSEKINKDQKVTISTTIDYLPYAEKIKNDWKESINIPIEIELINQIPNKYQILLLPQTVPIDPDQYYFWHSLQQGKTNITNLSSPKIDILLEQGRNEHEITKRQEIYSDFQKTLSEELPAIFLFYLTEYTYVRL